MTDTGYKSIKNPLIGSLAMISAVSAMGNYLLGGKKMFRLEKESIIEKLIETTKDVATHYEEILEKKASRIKSLELQANVYKTLIAQLEDNLKQKTKKQRRC